MKKYFKEIMGRYLTPHERNYSVMIKAGTVSPITQYFNEKEEAQNFFLSRFLDSEKKSKYSYLAALFRDDQQKVVWIFEKSKHGYLVMLSFEDQFENFPAPKDRWVYKIGNDDTPRPWEEHDTSVTLPQRQFLLFEQAKILVNDISSSKKILYTPSDWEDTYKTLIRLDE